MCKRLLHFVFSVVQAVAKCESGRAIFLPPVKREGEKITVLKCTTQNVIFGKRNVLLEENGSVFLIIHYLVYVNETKHLPSQCNWGCMIP